VDWRRRRRGRVRGAAREGRACAPSPTNYSWALELQVEDLDGNVLRLGSDPRKGEPVGEWLDMHGDAWVKSADGDWTRVDRD
jgi:hypothetical protein